MNNYFNTKNKELCNGCGACALRCPKNAIEMLEDEEGFLYPKINKQKCIKCGLCEKVCSNFNEEKKEVSKAYIAINNNQEELKKCASGGMFYILARYVIENNGVVFGVVYDENLKVIHKYAENLNDCKQFSGSKYVRSDLKNTYQETKKFLDEGRMVLYTGTACQLNGLKKFLGKEYEKLILCDILCHANPSPKIFELYKKNIEKKYNNKIKDIRFRDKETGWKKQVPIIEFENGVKIEENSYRKAFAVEMINRPSCSTCVFASTNRIADFTIGDFWGIEQIKENLKTENGVSLLMVNTAKGNKILENISNQMFLEEVELQKIIKYNHFNNVPVHEKRKKFFEKVAIGEINDSNIIENMNKYTKRSLFRKIYNKMRKILHMK